MWILAPIPDDLVKIGFLGVGSSQEDFQMAPETIGDSERLQQKNVYEDRAIF